MKKTKQQKTLMELIIDELNKELKYELRKQAKKAKGPLNKNGKG